MSLARRTVRLDEEYAFDCTLCGECCRGDIRISLNLNDLWKMAKHLEFQETGHLFESGWVAEEPLKEGGFRPYIRFKEKPMRFCPFLENRLQDDGELIGLCRLHPDSKPLVCTLAPIGREVEFPDLETWFFTEPIEGCPGCREEKRCQVRQTIAPLEEELALERLYFQVMETMQRNFCPYSEYQRFHHGLGAQQSLEAYLHTWLSKLEFQ